MGKTIKLSVRVAELEEQLELTKKSLAMARREAKTLKAQRDKLIESVTHFNGMGHVIGNALYLTHDDLKFMRHAARMVERILNKQV